MECGAKGKTRFFIVQPSSVARGLEEENMADKQSDDTAQKQVVSGAQLGDSQHLQTPGGHPLVSVIVGVYNKERFVGACLESVLRQTYSNWELIVVDDASTDGSLAVIQNTLAKEPRARIIRREENSGHPGMVRNQALRKAKGKYVAFLDGDDAWKPEKLAVQVAYMEMHPEYPMSHTVCEEIDESGKVLRVRHGGNLPAPGDCLRALFRHCFISTSTVMVRRDFGDRMGWFIEAPEYRCGEDYDFFVRCAREHGVGIPEGIWGQYRNVGGSISHRDANWKGTPSDYVRSALFLRRKELWTDRVSVDEMRDLAWQAAMENCQYWRAREKWCRACWFGFEMLKLRPLAVDTWRQLGGVALRRQ